MAKTAAPIKELRLKLNLLHPNEIPPSLPTRFLRWIVSYGRYIVIFTEVIVVSAFVFRFKLDADLDQLKTDINKDLPYIEGLVADEALIRQTQLKLQTIGTHYENTPDWQMIFDTISSEIPSSASLTNLSFDNSDEKNPYIPIKMVGSASSSNDLSVFIKKLREKNDKNNAKLFKDITLDSLSFEKNKLIFSISGAIKRS